MHENVTNGVLFIVFLERVLFNLVFNLVLPDLLFWTEEGCSQCSLNSLFQVEIMRLTFFLRYKQIQTKG